MDALPRSGRNFTLLLLELLLLLATAVEVALLLLVIALDGGILAALLPLLTT